MNIERIHIRGLFGNLNHDLTFRTSERVMLLVGLNGSGKTTVMKLIDTLFNQSLDRLCIMPFQEIDLLFDDETQLTVRKEPANLHHEDDLLPLTLTFHQDGESDSFQPSKTFVNPKNLEFPISIIEDVVPVLDRVGARKWCNRETGSVLDLTDVLTTFSDYLPSGPQGDEVDIPDWLQDIKKSVKVLFVGIERLTRVSWRQLYGGGSAIQTTRTVSHCSKQLRDLIRKAIIQHGILSQRLDKTFLSRLVTNGEPPSYLVATLQKDLDEIKQKCFQLEEVGFLTGEQVGFDIPDLSHVDRSQQAELAVYAEDAKEKLAVFDDLCTKISIFKKILNSRFSQKQITVSKDGLHVNKYDGTNLGLELLSSGEQHELVMLHALLFCAPGNSLILIDQPEISLHVSWKKRWLKDIEEISSLFDLRAIVSTHSPVIIDDKWSLTVECKLYGGNVD